MLPQPVHLAQAARNTPPGHLAISLQLLVLLFRNLVSVAVVDRVLIPLVHQLMAVGLGVHFRLLLLLLRGSVRDHAGLVLNISEVIPVGVALVASVRILKQQQQLGLERVAVPGREPSTCR